MTAERTQFDVADRLGEGGAYLTPSSDPTYNLAETLRLRGRAISKAYATATTMTASLAKDRANGQLSVKLDDFTLWIWEAAATDSADSSHIIPTDVGVGAGRFVKFVTASTAATTSAAGTQSAADKAKQDNEVAVHVRGVVDANVGTLSAFAGVAGGTAVNGVTYAAGDIVLLVAQTTPAQDGFYVVGTVGGGTAPLTRPNWWAAGAAIPPGTVAHVGGEDTAYPGSDWKAMCITGKVVGTDAPLFYPRTIGGTVTLSSGVKALGATQKLWLFATTRPMHATRNTAGTSTATTGGYAIPLSTRTAGKIGTAAATITAQAADGSTNTADVSTIDWTAHNW